MNSDPGRHTLPALLAAIVKLGPIQPYPISYSLWRTMSWRHELLAIPKNTILTVALGLIHITVGRLKYCRHVGRRRESRDTGTAGVVMGWRDAVPDRVQKPQRVFIGDRIIVTQQ